MLLWRAAGPGDPTGWWGAGPRAWCGGGGSRLLSLKSLSGKMRQGASVKEREGQRHRCYIDMWLIVSLLGKVLF